MMSEKIDGGVTIASKFAVVFLAGWFACSSFYGNLTLTQKAATLDQVQTVTIPKLKAQAHCEDARADKTAKVAKDAIKGALVDSAPIPSPAAIPQDNCPHVAGK